MTLEKKLKRSLRRRTMDCQKHLQRKYGTEIVYKTMAFLGCSSQELKNHIESQFKSGMTWGNKGDGVWNIDHIIPLSAFNLKNKQHFILANHYCNLRPVWKKDNEYKGSKYPSQHMLDTILNRQ